MSHRKQERMLSIKRFSSFEEENLEEHHRLFEMTPEQRLEEFEVLQERAWGKKWTKEKIKKIVRIEKVPWL